MEMWASHCNVEWISCSGFAPVAGGAAPEWVLNKEHMVCEKRKKGGRKRKREKEERCKKYFLKGGEGRRE